MILQELSVQEEKMTYSDEKAKLVQRMSEKTFNFANKNLISQTQLIKIKSKNNYYD